MTRFVPAVGVILAAAAVLATSYSVLQSSPARALSNCDVSHEAMAANEQEMLALINAERATRGAAPFISSPSLNRAAAWMSEDMSRHGLSHTDSLGRSPFKRMPDCGYPNSGAAENVGVGTSDALAMLRGFETSPAHWASMMNPGYSVIGIGEYNGWWTLDFGNIDDSGLPQPTPSTPTLAIPTPTPSPTLSPTPIPTLSPVATPSPLPRLTFGRAVVALVASD